MALPSISNAAKSIAIYPVSTTAGATTTGTVDTLGYDFCTIDVLLPTADVVSNKPATLKLSESDDTNSSNFADVTGFVGGTSPFTIPNCFTSTSLITQPYATFNVDTRARKRYLKLSVSPQTTQIITAVAQLTRAAVTPSTSSQATVVVNG